MYIFIVFAKYPILEAHILNVTSVTAHSTMMVLEYIKIHLLFVPTVGLNKYFLYILVVNCFIHTQYVTGHSYCIKS